MSLRSVSWAVRTVPLELRDVTQNLDMIHSGVSQMLVEKFSFFCSEQSVEEKKKKKKNKRSNSYKTTAKSVPRASPLSSLLG